MGRWSGRVALLAPFACAACVSAPGYSLESYKMATSLKAEVQSLASDSAEDYSAHAADVKALNIKMQAAFNYAAGLPDNTIVAGQWRKMLAPEEPLYASFVNRWRANGHFSVAEAANYSDLMGRAFDQIICAEANKQALTKCGGGRPSALSAQGDRK